MIVIHQVFQHITDGLLAGKKEVGRVRSSRKVAFLLKLRPPRAGGPELGFFDRFIAPNVEPDGHFPVGFNRRHANFTVTLGGVAVPYREKPAFDLDRQPDFAASVQLPYVHITTNRPWWGSAEFARFLQGQAHHTAKGSQ